MRLRITNPIRRKNRPTDEPVADPAADAIEDEPAERTGSSPSELTDEEWAEFRKLDPKAAERYMSLNDKDTTGRRKGVIWRRRIIRTVIILIALLVLLRACVRPTPDLSGMAEQDAAGAQTFAAAYVKDWYTWDEEERQERGQRLALYNPAFDANTGWNGQGTQTVTDAAAIDTEHPEDDKYVVTVRYTTDVSDNPGYASVAIFSDNGSYSPLSQPAMVAPPNLPAPTRPADNRAQVSDSEEVNAITDRLEVFFKAWSSGDTSTVDAVTTGNGPKTTLNNGATFGELRSVTVYAPGDDPADANRRETRVVVSWEQQDGASTIESTYGVVMVDEGGRWLVDEINGGIDNPDAYVRSDSTQPATDAPTESASPTGSASAPVPPKASESPTDDGR